MVDVIDAQSYPFTNAPSVIYSITQINCYMVVLKVLKLTDNRMLTEAIAGPLGVLVVAAAVVNEGDPRRRLVAAAVVNECDPRRRLVLCGGLVASGVVVVVVVVVAAQSTRNHSAIIALLV